MVGFLVGDSAESISGIVDIIVVGYLLGLNEQEECGLLNLLLWMIMMIVGCYEEEEE